MLSSIKLLIAFIAVLSCTISFAQIKNSKTEKVKISGNCGMCKTKIEKSGSVNNVCKINWNSDTKVATITYDATKTSKSEILKRISLVGYDNEMFTAPNDVYNNLHGCCQYDRTASDKEKKDTVGLKN
jgi:hypothetical protein